MREEDARFFEWPQAVPTDLTVGTVLRDLMAVNGWRYADKWADAANRIAPTIVGGSKKHGGADLGPTRAKRAWAELKVDGKGVADEAPGRRDPSFNTRLPRLTNEMVARVQGWGAPGYEWEFLGRKTSVYRQIGNAFPPPVAEAIGDSIADALHRRSTAREIAAGREHDELYALLRATAGPLHESDIISAVSLDAESLTERLDRLAKDFDLDVFGAPGDRSVALGQFRAFRGQDQHHRHEAFAARATRARVS